MNGIFNPVFLELMGSLELAIPTSDIPTLDLNGQGFSGLKITYLDGTREPQFNFSSVFSSEQFPAPGITRPFQIQDTPSLNGRVPYIFIGVTLEKTGEHILHFNIEVIETSPFTLSSSLE